MQASSPGWAATYFVHPILLHTELPAIAVGSLGSRFQLLLLECLVLLKDVLSQLVNAGRERKLDYPGFGLAPYPPAGQARGVMSL